MVNQKIALRIQLYIIFFVVLGLLGLGFNSVGLAEEYTPVSIQIDNEKIEFQGQGGIYHNSNPFVPAKELFEKFGATVEWDAKTSTLKVFQYNSLRIEIQPNKDVGNFVGKPFLMDQKPIVVNGTMMVPYSIITQLFNYGANYEPISSTLTINTKTLIMVDPYESYNLQNKNKNSTITQVKSIPATERVKNFKNLIKDYMGKTIYYRNTYSAYGIQDAVTGQSASINNLTPMWIENVEFESDELKVQLQLGVDVGKFKITLKSGNNKYIYRCAGSGDMIYQFLPFNPIPSNLTQKQKSQWEKVKHNQVEIGMNSWMVMLAWGEPTRKNITQNASGKHEQWVYDRKYSGTKYLYLHNDLLTTIQTSE